MRCRYATPHLPHEIPAPLKVKYHLRVPNYAESAGSRLFVQPAVFRKGRPPLFESATRSSFVIFDHQYMEHDDVTITLPDGFELEAGNAPDDLPLRNFGRYETSIKLNKSTRQLQARREFALHAVGLRADRYPALKQTFDGLHARDNHVLTLKQVKTAPEPPGETAASVMTGAITKQ